MLLFGLFGRFGVLEEFPFGLLEPMTTMSPPIGVGVVVESDGERGLLLFGLFAMARVDGRPLLLLRFD